MNSARNSPIILALDTHDISTAQKWIKQTSEAVGIYKIGLEFFLKNGAEGVAQLQREGNFEIFLDLKLHDIPNTVAGAAQSVKAINPKFLSVHAAGGKKMINAAVLALPSTSITAVTILTSLDDQDLVTIGYRDNVRATVENLARMAVEAGARSIVCSPLEVASIRAIVGAEIIIITPGVRPQESAHGDQVRTLTPVEAMSAGANYLVIGRPITAADSPGKAALEIFSAIVSRPSAGLGG